MKKSLLKTMMVAMMLPILGCSSKSGITVADQITNAKENKKIVLLVVSDDNTNANNIISMANDAIEGMSNVEIIEMNSSDERNSALIEEYQIQNVPLPIMLVFTDRGIPISGLLEREINPMVLKNIIPSSGFSDISYFISEGKSVLINITENSFNDDATAKALCSSVVAELNGEAETIVIDANSQTEGTLFKMLGIHSNIDNSMIIVINKLGAEVGRFSTTSTKEDIISAIQASINRDMHNHSEEDCECCQ